MNLEPLVISVLTYGSMYAILTMSLQVQYARGGMINFGIVAYFAAGAYAYAIVTQEPPSGLDQYLFGFDAPWWAGVLAAPVAAAAFAALTGWPTLRLRGEYLALTTFAFAEVLHSFLLNERRIGNGSVGLANITQPDPPGIDTAHLYAAAAVVMMLATLLFYRRLLASPYGRAMDAIRDDELAAQTVGKDIARIRFEIFVLTAIPIGLAGALFAMITTLVAPNLFTAEVTFLVWIALILGGERTIWGAVLGTLALVTFEELVRAYPFETVRGAQVAASVEEVVTGLIFILILRWQPFDRAARQKSGTP
ncbi:branched-chain amino acid ABC transporter permease [Acuticoccus sediminis]|uniref:Branched-chain amino acid ABC transporter permease n=1 Tax=Acuticoccus sediminis TaxID=2184697 RepID=A0A8B2NP80_9HYPH|nr:branched-chain amino acid ABC transporter permease [Acuticoccus sediminis]RAI01696.1 branched-chain amino acid ABC transporter permease [Acuticoccus sediminis]